MTIAVVPHDPRWHDDFEREAQNLRSALRHTLRGVHHIGSTAIAAVLAKPVIDMLGVVDTLDAVDDAHAAMLAIGYVGRGEHGIAGRRYFVKPDARGASSHHLHIFRVGAEAIERHLAFRDYLRAHPATARRYSDLKASIVRAGCSSRQAYQDAKAPFVDAILSEAVTWHRQRRKCGAGSSA